MSSALDAIREAAEMRGVLPREMQSITWEAVRGMFTDVQKRDKEFVLQINEIWDNYTKGKIEIDEAREQIFDTAGGIRDPEWVRTPPDNASPKHSTYSGQLYRVSDLGGTGPVGSGRRGGNAQRAPFAPGSGGVTTRPLNARGGVQVTFDSGHQAIRVSSRGRFKVYSPLKKFIGIAGSIEDAENLLYK